MQQKSRMNDLTFKIKNNMEKKKYEFKAFNSKGKEIELPGDCIFECTKDEAFGVQLGILIGLQSKYKDPEVTFREI